MTGKQRTATVAWKSLKHAHGPATRVPEQVKALLADNQFARDQAYAVLRDTLVGDGEWFEASAPTASLLLDSVENTPEPHRTWLLLADIMAADHARLWRLGPEAGVVPAASAVRSAVLARKALLIAALGAAAPAIRASASVLLTLLTPELGVEAVQRLQAQAQADPEPIVRANALLSLACLGSAAESLRNATAQGVEFALERGAREVAALRADDARPLSTNTSGLVDWFSTKAPGARSFESPQVQLAWFARYTATYLYRGLPGPDQPVLALLAVLERRGAQAKESAVSLISSLAAANPGYFELHAGKVLLALGGFPKDQGNTSTPVMRVEECSEPQRAMAKRLAHTHLVPVPWFGMPASGACRARWIGVEPPGPLDRVVEVTIGKHSETLPLWQALTKLDAREQAFPPAIDGLLSGLDRWEVLVHRLAGSYTGGGRTSPEALERELAVASEPGFFERASSVAADLAERYRAYVRSGLAVAQNVRVSSLLLLPFVRAGRAIDEAWDELVAVSNDPLAREVFAYLPAARRERILLAYLASADAELEIQRAGHVVELIDLAPSPRLARAILEKAAPAQQSLPEVHRIIVKLLDEAAAKYPELREP